MVVRVFAFIWGAHLLSLVLFSTLVTFVDILPPADIWHRAERDFLQEELQVVYASGGAEGAEALWRQIARAHPTYAFETDPLCAAPVMVGDAGGGCFQLVYHGPVDGPLAQLRPFSLPLLLGALVSAVMAIFLSSWLTGPIRAVSRGLRSLAAGRLDTRMSGGLRTTSQDIERLGRDFDHAAERLQLLADGRNRLFHDISHEIRSPLARLRAAVGLIEVNPARGASLAGRMEGDIARLDHLVDEILTLARYERETQGRALQRLDLLDLVENIISDANFEGRAREVTVSYSGAESLELQGDPELLHRAFENVVRNALSHSPQGGRVAVTGRREGEKIVLEIADEGPGVADADLKDIFSPFVRGERAGPASGVGLGLTIASSALHAHGGTVTARNRLPRGLLIVIEIPQAPAAPARWPPV